MSTALATRSSAPVADTYTVPAKLRKQGSVHDKRWVILAVLCLSLFISVLDDTIMNVTLPSLVRQLGATTSQLQWIVDSYSLVFAGGTPFLGGMKFALRISSSTSRNSSSSTA